MTMRTLLRRLVLALVAVSALAWPPLRHWAADVLAVTARHLDHGPDVEPPPGALERGQRRFAGMVADALINRGRSPAPEHHDTNGRAGPVV